MRTLIEPTNLDQEIFWQDGMMLSAGHMNHLTSRLANVAFHHTASAIPFPWGVHSYKIDADTIPQGVFTLVVADAVLPD